MTTAAWRRVDNGRKVAIVEVALVAVCMVAAYAGGRISHAPTITHTRVVTLTPTQAVSRMTAAELVAALGKPAAQQQESGGVLCDVWQSPSLEICYRP